MKVIRSVFFMVSFFLGMTGSLFANLEDGLVAHYEFEGNANDSSGNNYHGTEHGGVSYVNGKISKASSFDGVDDYIDLNGNLGLTSFPLSINFWINTQDETKIISGNKNVNGLDKYYGFSARTRGDDLFSTFYGNGVGGGPEHRISYITPSSTGISNKWSMITLKYIDIDTVLMYVDGKIFQIDRNYSGTATTVDFENAHYNILRYPNNGNWDYDDAQIDDLRIYKRALSEEEINKLFLMGNSMPIVNITSTSSSIFTNQTISFASNASDSDGSIASYLWNFGDGTTSTEPNPSHTYSSVGTYTVSCAVTDNDGSSTTKSITISVTEKEIKAEDITIVNISVSKTSTYIPTTLNLSATVNNPDNLNLVYTWDIINIDKNMNFYSPQGLTATFDAYEAGTYSISFRVNDTNGEQIAIKTTSITLSKDVESKFSSPTVTSDQGNIALEYDRTYYNYSLQSEQEYNNITISGLSQSQCVSVNIGSSTSNTSYSNCDPNNGSYTSITIPKINKGDYLSIHTAIKTFAVTSTDSIKLTFDDLVEAGRSDSYKMYTSSALTNLKITNDQKINDSDYQYISVSEMKPPPAWYLHENEHEILENGVLIPSLPASAQYGYNINIGVSFNQGGSTSQPTTTPLDDTIKASQITNSAGINMKFVYSSSNYTITSTKEYQNISIDASSRVSSISTCFSLKGDMVYNEDNGYWEQSTIEGAETDSCSNGTFDDILEITSLPAGTYTLQNMYTEGFKILSNGVDITNEFTIEKSSQMDQYEFSLESDLGSVDFQSNFDKGLSWQFTKDEDYQNSQHFQVAAFTYENLDTGNYRVFVHHDFLATSSGFPVPTSIDESFQASQITNDKGLELTYTSTSSSYLLNLDENTADVVITVGGTDCFSVFSLENFAQVGNDSCGRSQADMMQMPTGPIVSSGILTFETLEKGSYSISISKTEDITATDSQGELYLEKSSQMDQYEFSLDDDIENITFSSNANDELMWTLTQFNTNGEIFDYHQDGMTFTIEILKKDMISFLSVYHRYSTNSSTSQNTHTTTISLKEGWNLISSPTKTEFRKLNGAPPAIGTQGFEMLGDYDTIWGFKNNQWSKDPDSIKSSEGFWVKIKSDKTVEFSGESYRPDFSTLDESWVLMGTGEVLTDIKEVENIGIIWIFDSVTGWLRNPEEINPGQGFWIKK